MSELFEAQGLKGRAIDVELGLDGQGRPRARWNMIVEEGEHKGKIAQYSGKLSGDNVKWTKKDMKAIGWKGVKSATFVADVKAANLVVEFNARIAEHNGSSWTAAEFRGATPLAALDTDAERELDRLFAEAGDDAPVAEDALPF